MKYFIRLVRPLNLAIIGLTMYGVRFYLLHVNPTLLKIDDPFSFFLLVHSTIFIASAGNIINDYFDVKADRINKPEKLIITKHIEKRWAIVTHWLLNGIGFLIGLVLSIRYNSFSLVFIHLLSINALWFYSLHLKRKILISNVIIALLTAFIPLMVLLFYKVLLNNMNQIELIFNGLKLIIFLALFAFIQNLAREIIKDTQDVTGDLSMHVQSIPIRLGKFNALLIASALLSLLPFFYLLALVNDKEVLSPEFSSYLTSLPVTIAIGLNCLVIALILVFKTARLNLYNMLVKLSMLSGISVTIYLPFINT